MWPFSKQELVKEEQIPEPKFKVGQWVLCAYLQKLGCEIISVTRGPHTVLSYQWGAWQYCVKGYKSEHTFHVDEKDVYKVITEPPAEIKYEWCVSLNDKLCCDVSRYTTNLESYFYGYERLYGNSIKTFEMQEAATDYLIENGEKICKIVSTNKCLSRRVLAEKIRRALKSQE
jgi:hypothetical protein